MQIKMINAFIRVHSSLQTLFLDSKAGACEECRLGSRILMPSERRLLLQTFFRPKADAILSAAAQESDSWIILINAKRSNFRRKFSSRKANLIDCGASN